MKKIEIVVPDEVAGVVIGLVLEITTELHVTTIGQPPGIPRTAHTSRDIDVEEPVRRIKNRGQVRPKDQFTGVDRAVEFVVKNGGEATLEQIGHYGVTLGYNPSSLRIAARKGVKDGRLINTVNYHTFGLSTSEKLKLGMETNDVAA